MPTREMTDGEILKTLMCLADMFGDFGGNDELIEHIIQKLGSMKYMLLVMVLQTELLLLEKTMAGKQSGKCSKLFTSV